MAGDRFYGKLENDGNLVVYAERLGEVSSVNPILDPILP